MIPAPNASSKSMFCFFSKSMLLKCLNLPIEISTEFFVAKLQTSNLILSITLLTKYQLYTNYIRYLKHLLR